MIQPNGASGFNPTTIFITLTGLAFVGLAALILVGDLLEFGPPESISVLIIPLLSAAGGLIFMVNGLGIALGLKANLTLTPTGLTIHRNAFGMSSKEHFIPLDDLYEVDTMRSTFSNAAGQYSAWGKHLRICSSDKSYDLGYYYPLAELEHARDAILNHLRMQVSSNDYNARDHPTASTNPPR